MSPPRIVGNTPLSQLTEDKLVNTMRNSHAELANYRVMRGQAGAELADRFNWTYQRIADEFGVHVSTAYKWVSPFRKTRQRMWRSTDSPAGADAAPETAPEVADFCRTCLQPASQCTCGGF